MFSLLLCFVVESVSSNGGSDNSPQSIVYAPPSFSGISDDCEADLLKFVLNNKSEAYTNFILRLPRCEILKNIPNEEICIRPWCSVLDKMVELPTCREYACTSSNFFPATYGPYGLVHGPGTMHPCGREWAIKMIDRCVTYEPGLKYTGCGPFGPEGHAWGDLNEDIISKLTSFGWEKSLWDAMEEDPETKNFRPPEEFPDIELQCWGKLEPEITEQLIQMGFTPEGWHSCGYMARRFRKKCEHPSTEPRENGTCVAWREHAESVLWGKPGEHIGTPRTKWGDLPPYIQGNLTALGHNDAELWDLGQMGSFALRRKKWDLLTEDEKEAAIALRWNVFSWDGCPHSECIERLSYVERFTYPVVASRSWSTLNPGYKALISILGWTEKSWDIGKIPLTLSKPWDSVKDEVKITARTLGHTKDTWEKCPKSNCIKRMKYMMHKWWPNGKPVEWNQMPEERRKDWQILGYTRGLWMANQQKPKIYYTSWDRLTDEEKSGARNLGYDMSSWDGCANPTRMEELDTSVEDTRDPYRLVQGKMNIMLPFKDISVAGKVNPKFYDYFTLAVTQSMFCHNIFEKDYSGQCYDRDSYERQKDRFSIIRVQVEPLAVIFRIAANRTAVELAAVQSLEYLHIGLTDPSSSIRTDDNFQEYATVARVEEMPFSQVQHDMEKAELVFEELRKNAPVEENCDPILDRDCPGSMAPNRREMIFNVLLFTVLIL